MEILLVQIFIPLIAALIILASGKTLVRGIAGVFSSFTTHYCISLFKFYT